MSKWYNIKQSMIKIKKRKLRENIHFSNIHHGAPFFRNCTIQVIDREVTVIDREREREGLSSKIIHIYT